MDRGTGEGALEQGVAELDEAIDFYSQLADFDESDLAETVHFVEEEAAKLAETTGEKRDAAFGSQIRSQ